jgi:hypothetical protein
MVDRIIVKNKEKKEKFYFLTEEILSEASEEKENGDSLWNTDQIDVVCSEFSLLKSHILEGYLYFQFGKKCRMLQSTYILTDSFPNLNGTKLGRKIAEFQEEFSRY